ncbi:nucleoside 2-deoxyribosyltransferase domain-containing protein [Neolewinella persica]|uniref:nucleoside 2-deoxyribosyltransferase domain-containing protein n=1 Tax=Neolewinella persica TaxID=70998 RepID=UPI00035FEEAE|nr:nucleoside 2-deoxyribosyltransferase domain-containing protein [Neolewinella persica]
MKEITPPHSLSAHHRRPYAVFLAGSIEMGVAEDWQAKVTDYFVALADFTVLNPRRADWDSNWEQTFTSPNFYQQVNWELNGLDRATHIILNLLPGTKSPISLLELGLYAASGKLIICCPTGFWRKGNVDIVAERYGIPVYEKMEELLADNFGKA